MNRIHRHFQKQFTKVHQLIQQFHDSHEKCCDRVLEFVQLVSKWDMIHRQTTTAATSATATAASVTTDTQQLVQGSYMAQLETLLCDIRSVLGDEWGHICSELEKLVCDSELHYAQQHQNLHQWFRRDNKHWMNVSELLDALRETALSVRRERDCKLLLLERTLARYALSGADRRRVMIPLSTPTEGEQMGEDVHGGDIQDSGDSEEDDADNEDGDEDGSGEEENVLAAYRLPSTSKTIQSVSKLGAWSGDEVYGLFCRSEYVDLDAIMEHVQRSDDLVREDVSESHRSLIDLRTSPTR